MDGRVGHGAESVTPGPDLAPGFAPHPAPDSAPRDTVEAVPAARAVAAEAALDTPPAFAASSLLLRGSRRTLFHAVRAR